MIPFRSEFECIRNLQLQPCSPRQHGTQHTNRTNFSVEVRIAGAVPLVSTTQVLVHTFVAQDRPPANYLYIFLLETGDGVTRTAVTAIDFFKGAEICARVELFFKQGRKDRQAGQGTYIIHCTWYYRQGGVVCGGVVFTFSLLPSSTTIHPSIHVHWFRVFSR